MAIGSHHSLWQYGFPTGKGFEGESSFPKNREEAKIKRDATLYQSFCDLGAFVVKEFERYRDAANSEKRGQLKSKVGEVGESACPSIYEILESIDEILHLFNEDFLSKEMRYEVMEMLDNGEEERSLYHIMAAGDYPLDRRYREKLFRFKLYTSEGKRWLLGEIDRAKKRMESKIEELQAIDKRLQEKEIEPIKQREASLEIRSRINITRRPIKMLDDLKVAIEEAPCEVRIGSRASRLFAFPLREIFELEELT